MALNLDKFIKIIIKSGENSSRFASRDTAVLICDTLNVINPASADYTLLESYEDLVKNVSNPSETLKKYVHIFFDNKGVKLKLVKLINNDFKFESGRYVQDWFPIFTQVHLSDKIAFINESPR